nr:uncharacterized protein LOC115129126 [Oncorhynchus nerka]
MPEQSSMTMPEQSPMAMPDQSSMTMPEQSSMAMPDQSSMTMPEQSSMTMPEQSPMAMPDQSSMTMPEQSSMAMPEQSSMAMPEQSSMAMPEQSSMAMPEQSSMTMPYLVVVVNVDGSLVQHPLTCLGSFNREEEGWRRDNDWVWRRDGEEDEEIIWMMDEEEKKKGNSFLVNLEERTGGGIFTCHSLDRTLLKNTTVLVKHLDEEKRILEGSTRTVRPDNVYIKEVNRSTIEWSYPVSWNRPISYFPLSFQVKEIEGRKCKNGCTCDSPYTEVHTTESSQWSVKAKVTVCVRAQDALCDSPWSDWTEYRSVPHSLVYCIQQNLSSRTPSCSM